MNEPDVPFYFGDWIKHRRKELDLTQTELAERASCSVFALRKIEAGKRRPSKQLAAILAGPLQIPFEHQTTFIKVARGELGIEKLTSFVGDIRPGRRPSPISANLARPLTPFIGREPELVALTKLLQDSQCALLTIVGPGGIGKTRLAIEAAQRSKDLFPDGVWFVSLASLNSPILIVPAIADVLGFTLQDPIEPQTQLLRYLHAKRALLVLDNVEHLLEDTSLFAKILNDCPQIKLLVTSRERLNLLSEWVFEIKGLPVPLNDRVMQFDTYSSVALFLQTARRIQAGFEIRDEERQWVLKICQIMEGMPLGIELSAAWVGLLPVEEIAIEIEHDLDFLSASMSDLPERHRSLRATLDHSWKLLDPEEQLILSRLSVFRGHFSRKAAQAVCGASLAVLSSLKNKSLLQRTDQGDYVLHEIIRQYADLKMVVYPDENEHIKDKHALYFVEYLSNCEALLQGSAQVETINDMAKIVDNISQGWQHMITHCLPAKEKDKPFSAELLNSSIFSLSLFYEMRCRSLEALPLFREAVDYLKAAQAEFEATEDATSFYSVLGHAIAYLGLHHVYILQYEQGNEYLEEALRWLERGQSRVGKAQVQVILAGVKDIYGQLQESVALLAHSREVLREAGEDWWYALSTINLAGIYLSLGEHQKSEALFQEGFQLVKPGDLRLELVLRYGFALEIFLQNDPVQAKHLLQTDLQLSYQLGNDRQTAYILFALGRVVLADLQVEQAENYLQKSFNILQQFGESRELAMTYLYLGKCSAARQDGTAAHHQFRQVIRIGLGLNKFYLVYWGLANIGRIYLMDGQIKPALDIFLLLRHCPIEYKSMQDDFNGLHADLQAALPEGQVAAAEEQVDSEISLDQSKADVHAYVQLHETE